MTSPASSWFEESSTPRDISLQRPASNWFPDPVVRRPHWSDRIPQAVDMITSPISTGLQLGAGMAGWPVGAVAGVGSLLGEKLKGSTAEEQAGAFDTAMEKHAGAVGNFLSPQLPNQYAAPAVEIAGKGIEFGLGKVKQLAGVKRGLPRIIPLEESHPAAAKVFGVFAELMAFKAGHVVGVKAKRALGRQMRRFEKLKETPDAMETEVRKIVDEEMTPELEQKLLEYNPELFKKVTEEFQLRGVTEETSRRPIRGEAPVGEQKLLEAPKEVPGAGEPGGGTDLAPSGSPKLSPQKRSVGAAGRKLGVDIVYEKTVEQPEGFANQHGFTARKNGKTIGSFVVEKNGRPVAKDIVEAGQLILDQRKTPEKIKDLVVANVSTKGKTYYGEAGDLHSTLYSKYPGVKWKKEGFAGPDGKFLTKKEALEVMDVPIAEDFKEFTKDGLEAITYLRSKAEAEQKILDTRKPKEEVRSVQKLNKGEEKTVVERKPGKIGKTEITREELKDITPEEASQNVSELLPEVRSFLEEGVGDAVVLKEKLNNAIKGVPLEERVVFETERLMSAINDRIGGEGRYAKETGAVAEKVSTEKGVEGKESRQIRLRDNEKARLEAKEKIEVTPEAVAGEVERIVNKRVKDAIKASEMKRVIEERQKALFETTEKSRKASKELETDVRQELLKEVVAEEKVSKKDRRKAKEESEKEYEKLGEEYADLYKEDYDLADYGIKEMGKDIVDLFIKNEDGSFSANMRSVEDIKKLHKVWKKARDLGREIGEYLEASFPRLNPEDLQKLRDFINEHFEGSELFDISEGPVLRKGKTRLWKKGTPQERTIRHLDYQRSWYDNWQKMKPVKFLKSVGGHYGTTAGHFFDQVKWLAEEVYYPYRKAVKEIKIRKQNIRKQFLNPLKKMVDKNSRRRIRDYAIVQQMYERGPDGKILIKNGKRVFKEHAQEFMAENRIKAIPKLDANELHVYNELRRGFDVLYEEINTMRANNGLTPFKKVPDYFTFMRTMSAFERVGLKGEFMGKDPTFVLKEFARMKELPFQWRHARVKYRKYRIKNEPFDIFESYADLAYDHIGISPIVAKVREMTSNVKRPMQKLTKKGTIGKKRFNPLKQGDNINAAEYLTEWSHKISGVPMKYEAPPLVRKGLNKINSNLGAAILGASARAVFIQPLALVGTYANIGMAYTLKGILDVPRPSKYRSARLKSDVLFSRTPEASIADNLGQLGELKISEFPKIARNLSFKGLEIFDNLTAHATWNGAYRQAKAGRVPHNRGKMSETEAIRYADDIVIKTQGSALPGERAPIQYTSWGKTTTMFQTFVINNWNMLAYDALALHPNTKIKHALPKITRYVFAAMAANFLYEDVGGMKSPLGRPVKALLDGLDDNNTAIDIGIDMLGEVIEPIPVLGSARYGSHPFGPLVEKVGEVFTGGKYGLSPAKELELLQSKGRFPDKSVQLGLEGLGVPGTGQAFKSYRAAKRGESPWGVIAGTYSKKRKKYSQK